MLVLERLLQEILEGGSGDRVVVVSNSTKVSAAGHHAVSLYKYDHFCLSIMAPCHAVDGMLTAVMWLWQTLEMVGALCAAHEWTTARICGDVSTAKRQDIVSAFNRHNVGQVRATAPPHAVHVWMQKCHQVPDAPW
jgi:hypothetical protein